AAPITLALRGDFGWLLQALRGGRVAAYPPEETSASLFRVLTERGALFFAELEQYSGRSSGELRDALWDAVARGLVTADGFSALRALCRGSARGVSMTRRAGGLRRGVQKRQARDGRWALLPQATVIGDREELAEALAEQLLARYGVVFRDLLQRESLGLPWRDVLWAFRRLEARGLIRGGRFVAGFVGEQFAQPEAVDHL